MKTRRAFIQTGAVALCGLAAAPALAKPRKPKDADWTETFEVIVIGHDRRFHGYQQRDHLRARQPAPKGTRH